VRQGFLPPAGIVSDDTTFSTPGYYADGSNVRFFRGKPQVIGGWSKYHATALTGTCRAALAWYDLDVYTNIAFGTHSKLQVLVSGELFDITPSGLSAGTVDSVPGVGYGAGSYGRDGYGDPAVADYYLRTWSLANWGENLLASPRGGKLYIWANNTAVVSTEVTQAPDQISVMVVTPSRQVLALGTNEEVSGTYNPLCVRFSDVEDYTDWTTSSNNLAGEVILEGAGRIIGAKMMGDVLGVWTDTSVYLGQFTGDYTQPWRFDLVSKNCGLISPNAVAVFNQVAFWISPDGMFYSWQVGAPPAPMNCPIRTDFNDNLVRTQADKIVAVTNGQWGEVWWFYPDARDGTENSRYLARNVADGAWFRGELARTAAIDAGPLGDPLWVSADSYAYAHETGSSADGGAISGFIETSDQYLGEAENWMMVKGIWPDFESQTGPVTLYVYGRPYPQADRSTYGPYTLAPSVSKKDFMAQMRLAAFRLEFNSSPSYWRLGKPSFDVVPTGQQ